MYAYTSCMFIIHVHMLIYIHAYIRVRYDVKLSHRDGDIEPAAAGIP